MSKKAWDEPYKNNKILSSDILIGAANDGSLIYLPADKGDPTRNVAVFYGSNGQKIDYLTTRIFYSVLGERNILVMCSDIKKEIYEFARKNDYIIKELNFDDPQSESNHWNILNLMKDEDELIEVQKFIGRIKKASKLALNNNQLNAFNYLSSVLLFTHYYSNENLKKVAFYLRNYDEFEKKLATVSDNSYIKHFFDYSKNANNYFKWDIPTISNVMHPFFSKAILKVLNAGSMSLDEFSEKKCIYIINPSTVCYWLPPFMASYLLDIDSDFDVYIDQDNFCIPDFNNAVKKCQHKIHLLSNNIEDIFSNYQNILSGFGTKISLHGCDIKAAEYLSKASGIDPGSNKYKGNRNPSEITSCGYDKAMLFVLSSKNYTYKSLNLSYLNDVANVSL